MKTDKDIMIDSLMARIRELETDNRNQQYTIKRLNIKDYLLGQYIFSNRIDLLNDFAKFAEYNYKECAYHYGYKDIEQQVIDILTDLADDIDKGDKSHYSELFTVLGGLKTTNN